jgi:hypothetical protein
MLASIVSADIDREIKEKINNEFNIFYIFLNNINFFLR